MNKIVEKELSKVLVADLSNFDKETNTYHIPKFKHCKLEVDKVYVVELDSTLLTPDDLDYFNINWNKGINPPSKYLEICVDNVKGKNIQVRAFSYDIENDVILNTIWNGWLPVSHLTLIKEL